MSEYKRRYGKMELDFAKRLRDFGKKLRDHGFCPVEFYSYYNNPLSAAMCRKTKPDGRAQLTDEGLKIGGSVIRYEDPVESWARPLKYDLWLDERTTMSSFLNGCLKDLQEQFKGRLLRAERSEEKRREQEEGNTAYAKDVRSFAEIMRTKIKGDEEVHLLKRFYNFESEVEGLPDYEILITTRGLEVREKGEVTSHAGYDSESWTEVLPKGSDEVKLADKYSRPWSEIRKKCLSMAMKNLEKILMER